MDCLGESWVTREYTPTTDRTCTPTLGCRNGLTDDGEACTCPGGATCATCFYQDANADRLLVRENEEPLSVALDPSAVCLGSAINATTASRAALVTSCQERCLAGTGCVGFFVFDLAAAAGLRGQCCLKSR